MKVQCNRCKELYDFEKHISIGTGVWQRKDVQLCKTCEIALWKFINGENYEIN